MKIIHRRFLCVSDVAATEPAASYHYRQIRVIVTIAVAQPAAVRQQGVIEEAAVAVWRGFQLSEKVAELLNVIGVDARDLFDPFRITAMMSQGVMGVGNADFAIGSSAALARQHES